MFLRIPISSKQLEQSNNAISYDNLNLKGSTYSRFFISSCAMRYFVLLP